MSFVKTILNFVFCLLVLFVAFQLIAYGPAVEEMARARDSSDQAKHQFIEHVQAYRLGAWSLVLLFLIPTMGHVTQTPTFRSLRYCIGAGGGMIIVGAATFMFTRLIDPDWFMPSVWFGCTTCAIGAVCASVVKDSSPERELDSQA